MSLPALSSTPHPISAAQPAYPSPAASAASLAAPAAEAAAGERFRKFFAQSSLEACRRARLEQPRTEDVADASSSSAAPPTGLAVPLATGPSAPSSPIAATGLAAPPIAATGPAAPPATGRGSQPRPMEIIDSRFQKGRSSRAICCDERRTWHGGNAVGAFWRSRGMLAVEFRRGAWERGEWGASWYCPQCYAVQIV